jgi:MATE family multidrug resistance protein
MVLNIRYKTILSVAIPLMVSSFIQSIVLLTDASMISRYSTLAFDAVGNGGLIYVTLYMALVGMGDGAQIIMARRIGQNRPKEVSKLFSSSLITHLFLAGVLFVLTQYIMPDWLLTYSKNKALAGLQGDYIRIRSFALFFAMITLSIQAVFLAKGKTWVVLVAAVVTALTNIVLDYGMIFGELGFSEMGLKGAAWASTIADGAGMLTLLFFLIFSRERKEFDLLSTWEIRKADIMELVKVGSPLMFQLFIALAVWTVFFTWIEQIGTFELTVSQNIRSIYFLAFVPIWGFAGTTKTYISQYLGQKEYRLIPIIQKRIQLLTIVFLLLFFHGAIIYPEQLIGMINPNDIYLDKSAEIMRFVAVSILLYGFVSVYFQTVNGSGNTMISFLIELTCIICYLISAYILIKVWQVDIFWIWSVEYVYFGIMGLTSYLYLRNTDWKKKVI